MNTDKELAFKHLENITALISLIFHFQACIRVEILIFLKQIIGCSV